MMNKTKTASALGAKTARACDGCMIVRARWYCAADDAFLCHGCDKLVHSANQLASKHERVKLQTASSKVNSQSHSQTSWHSGFTRKARTPRHNKNMLVQQQQQQPKDEEEKKVFFTNNTLPLVPELGSEEPFLDDENEEQLLFRVPVFDPFDEGICRVYNEVKGKGLTASTTMKNIDVVVGEEAFDLENFCSEFLPSDMGLDVESLLGNRVDEDSSGHVKRSTLLGCKEDEIVACVNGFNGANGAMVKVKGEELDADHTTFHLDSILDDMNGEEFDWNVEEKVGVPLVESGGVTVSELGTKKENFLRLNYVEVITAWASQAQGSPWTTGCPPKFNFDDCWPNFLGSSGGTDVQCSYEEVRSLMGQQIGGGDVGREARVSRYREKRRTRLFAKKIRYEVRKLNAEKRPRMKGRFVKRTSFVGATALQA